MILPTTTTATATALTLLTLLSPSTALPSQHSPLAKPATFLLAGDSTTATQSTNGGGWGDGFLNTTLHNGATGTNYGHNGRTTVDYRSGGDWAKVLAAVRSSATSYQPWVTIQFGHNDQKPEKNISVAQYTANLETFVTDVRSAGGEAILVTPLSRRNFVDGKVKEDLAAQAAATKVAAGKTGAAVVDLNRSSTDYLNAIGEADAHLYNLNAADNTHLNVRGSVVFGNMVSGLIDGIAGGVGASLATWTKPNATIWESIQKGQYVA